MKTIAILIFQVFLLALIACEKEDNDLPVTLKLELLDENSVSCNQFEYGENIIFSFKMTNNLDSILYYDLSFMNDEFFKVYLKDGDDLIAIGKPYVSLYLELRYGQFFISGNTTSGNFLPWISDSSIVHVPPCFVIHPNEPLEKGDYVTGFTSDFKFYTKDKSEIYELKNQSFEVNFIIE